MAESAGDGENLFVGMFRHFPVATVILCFVFVYLFWLSTGGVERGIKRHAEGKDSIFVEVHSLPGKEGKTFFGNIQVD
ncbi:MAG: hypothetical protein ACKKL4_02575 [Patescibacteria group bacterium]